VHAQAGIKNARMCQWHIGKMSFGGECILGCKLNEKNTNNGTQSVGKILIDITLPSMPAVETMKPTTIQP
jgi:hypothetical protein